MQVVDEHVDGRLSCVIAAEGKPAHGVVLSTLSSRTRTLPVSRPGRTRTVTNELVALVDAGELAEFPSGIHWSDTRTGQK
jgi:hypothetical protein